MAAETDTYPHYFKAEQQVKVGIKLADSKFLDVGCLVRSLAGERLTLEITGGRAVGEPPVEPNTEAYITTWTGWSLCRCSALLVEPISGQRITLRLTGPVVEKQTREYFRLDVSIPLTYRVPEKQLLTDVHAEWAANRGLLQRSPSPNVRAGRDGFRVIGWEGRKEIEPQRVNLSGGGLRFKTHEYIRPETLVAIDIFLPLIPPRVIHTVAEALRCNEIVLGRERGGSFVTALRFHFINEKDRETIIAFIFAEQRRILSAGKRY